MELLEGDTHISKYPMESAGSTQLPFP